MNRRAFTLIELLIVVAIIAILAAIAVPNFLEAQTRSKVSRCKADMRSVVTAIESYAVDNNKYPLMGDLPDVNGSGFHARVSKFITTPIAYMTGMVYDPFVSQDNTFFNGTYPYDTQVGKRYAYYETATLVIVNGSDVWDSLPVWVGPWLIYGYGPDRTPFHGAAATLLPYDPTNGTVSRGNIVRCAKSVDGTPVHYRTGTFFW